MHPAAKRILLAAASLILISCVALCAAYGIETGNLGRIREYEEASRLSRSLIDETDFTLPQTSVCFSADGCQVTGSGCRVFRNSVTITAPGVYALSGVCDDGQVNVDVSSGSVVLLLKDLSLSKESAPAIYIRQADHVLIYLPASSNSRIISGKAREIPLDTSRRDTVFASGAAIYSRDSLTIAGEGSLFVGGYRNNAIASTDHLFLSPGILDVVALNSGLKGKDSLTIQSGTISVTCGNDALQSRTDMHISGGTFDLSCGNHGINADHQLTILGGKCRIARGYEGIQAEHVHIFDGEFTIDVTDDGINASRPGTPLLPVFPDTETSLPSLQIDGGDLSIRVNGDGLDSNGTLLINGGSITIDGPSTSGDGALDAETVHGGYLTIHGGTVMAFGAANNVMSFMRDVSQPFFSATFAHALVNVDALTVLDENGTILGQCHPTKRFNNLVFSSPDLEVGKTYRICAGADTIVATAILSPSEP